MVRDQRGFTIIELIVAVTVFSIGLLALLGSNLLVYRLLGAGQRATAAAFYARERLETLRALKCPVLANGSETRGGVYYLSWQVELTDGGTTRRVRLLVTYPQRAGVPRTDTVETSILCAW